MSLAGRRSNQGDQYQLRIALHWLIRLLSDDGIQAVQIDSTGIPGREYAVTVDDIVILYKDSKTRYIQAKKNQPTYRAWSFSDLKEELVKVREQLKNDSDGEVEFYSRDNFGDFRVLVETCQLIPSYDAFLVGAAQKHLNLLEQFSQAISCGNEESFSFAKRIGFGPLHNFDGWDEENLRALSSQVPRAEDALAHLKELISDHESSLSAGSIQITREDVISKLQQHGLSPTPERSISEILESFSISSQIGRNWTRTVGNIAIPRPELDKLVRFIEEGKESILLTEGAGSGKTCLLLDLASYVENKKSDDWGLLFVKGDQFLSAQSESDLVDQGLPDDIVGRCARLAENRRVVVIVDSLDVLSLNRQHGSLRLFTGLINRLTYIYNVTVVAACRTFDLDYDASLKGMEWDGRVYIQPLDFESTIVPILKQWDIDPSGIDQTLVELLRIPQNLRLYKKILDSGVTPQVTTAYDLYNSFIQEVIIKKDSLGNDALEGIYMMVDHLRCHRAQYCDWAVLKLNEKVVRELVSQDVLYAKSTDTVAFGHQTLADCLTVRASIAKQQTLKGFILSQPQLPFIRPFVRAFLFHLRSHQSDQFSRQVTQVLSDDAVSYHIKRLICESLAEIKPTQDDWPLFRRLYQKYPELLKRTLIRLENMGSMHGEAWFFFLSENWLTLVHASASDQKGIWLRLFVQSAKCWMNKLPEETVGLWREAIDETWFEHRILARLISNQVKEFNFLHIVGLRTIFEAFLSSSELENEEYDSFVPEMIGRWIEANDSGDDLIWRYMVKELTNQPSDETDYSWNPYSGLRCEPHIFHKEDFIKERLERSDSFLNQAISAIRNWSQVQFSRTFSCLLRETSWTNRHSKGECYRPFGDISFLLLWIEKAIYSRATNNENWWRDNVRDLLDGGEDALAYFAIQACNNNINSNLSEIEYCLTDQNLLLESELVDEVGELMSSAYPYLSNAVQLETQRLIICYCCNPNVETEWKESHLYECYRRLRWIPAYFRTQEIQTLIDRCQSRFGEKELGPEVYMSGGIMSTSPIDSAEFIKLSDHSILKLFHYYGQVKARALIDSSFRESCSITFTLREASRVDPVRFLNLCSSLTQKNSNYKYLIESLEGASEHLRYRFDRLSFGKKLEIVEPIPSGETVSIEVIKILERYPLLFRDGRAVANTIKGCCSVVSDKILANRLVLLIFWLLSADHHNPEPKSLQSSHDLNFTAINSVLGITAESAIVLYNRLLENEIDPPPLLANALDRLSKHDESYVSIRIVSMLPYTIYQRPSFGWQLLENIFDKEEAPIWKESERIFYYNYDTNFDKVNPYLDRLAAEITEKNGDVWGRISALASLAGRITQSELFDKLRHLNNSAAEGVVQVFCTNLGKPQLRGECEAGLDWFLTQSSCSNDLLKKIEKCFSKKNGLNITYEFANKFLDGCSRSSETVSLSIFPQWLADEARKNPFPALKVLEKLISLMNINDASLRTYRTTELIEALIEIEREADDVDDLDMIQRTINLQDQFLEMDLYGMDALLDSSART